MKIKIVPYQDSWPKIFNRLGEELASLLHNFNPVIEHFGSTAVEGLSAKPVIDILVGIPSKEQFFAIQTILQKQEHYIHYSCFDENTPDRRLYVRCKDETAPDTFPPSYHDFDTIPHDLINAYRLSHIHIWDINSPEWTRHIAFRDYLRVHQNVRKAYQKLKEKLGRQEWNDGMAYNKAKDAFIKKEEKNALKWYASK